MLNQLHVSNTSGNFIVISSVLFNVLLLLHCINFLRIIPNLQFGIHKELLESCHRLLKELMLSTAPGFSEGKRVVEHCFI